jgi:hypothetical protein
MGILLNYFRSPFPSRHGFSPYRMPGPAVHVPAIFYTAVFGYLLCWPHSVLRPLLFIWVVAGIYLGRDFAILCHYMLPLPLVALVPALLLAGRAQAIARFGATHVVIPVVMSVGIALLQIAVAYLFTRSEHGR